MPILSLLYEKEYKINDKISVKIPTLREIKQCEEDYFSIVSALTSSPIDMMVQLDDAGIDFTEIDDYTLFLYLFNSIKNVDTSLVFGDMDLSKFEFAENKNTHEIVLINKVDDIVIDRVVYLKIAMVIRKIHYLKKDFRKPAGIETKKYMLQRAREKAARNKRRVVESQIDDLIISLVNTEQFKYGYDDVLDLTIYQFNSSVKQIKRKVDYDGLMIGIYAGTVNAKELSQDQLNWLAHKQED